MAHGAGRSWTEEEDRIIEDCKRRGESCVVISRRIDRTAKAIERRWTQLRAECGIVTYGNAIDRRATDRLGKAINKMFYRISNESLLPVEKVMQIVLGEEPGEVIRPSFKTASMQRHINAVQAEQMAA